ncbi:MAG: HAMP domain-containing histidine kinase [Bacteroidales bacterium]|nr:HAMP domain-containing histidine kinase [Bacteroidales bacterium]
MNIYSHKNSWKIFLFVFAALIILVSTWFTHNYLRKIAREEKAAVEIWAKAISRKAHLVNYTKLLFDDLQRQERKSVQIWSEATKRFIDSDYESDIKFYTDIISGNDNIPVIVTDINGVVVAKNNLDAAFDTITVLTGKTLENFTTYPPIVANIFSDLQQYIYYQDSRIFSQLKHTLDDLVQSFLDEVVENSVSTPVVILDSTRTHIISQGGQIDTTNLEKLIAESNGPITVEMPEFGTSYIYYQDSPLLTQLRYFPIILLVVIALFLLIAYILFSISRKAEQNQVWAGMAKESAHQLGTPISSLIGWIEILKEKEESRMEALEMEKDIVRLQHVSERFSKIGSKPVLARTDINSVIAEVIDYMKIRSPRRVKYEFQTEESSCPAKINPLLFSWVMENLLKNSLDAMDGQGLISIATSSQGRKVIIDITDTGKGVPKGKYKVIFNPGYSTKSRGWGLGLSLARRIIANYHRGKIFVKSSAPDAGTTFRIILNE